MASHGVRFWGCVFGLLLAGMGCVGVWTIIADLRPPPSKEMFPVRHGTVVKVHRDGNRRAPDSFSVEMITGDKLQRLPVAYLMGHRAERLGYKDKIDFRTNGNGQIVEIIRGNEVVLGYDELTATRRRWVYWLYIPMTPIMFVFAWVGFRIALLRAVGEPPD